jgi:hypothetical protein
MARIKAQPRKRETGEDAEDVQHAKLPRLIASLSPRCIDDMLQNAEINNIQERATSLQRDAPTPDHLSGLARLADALPADVLRPLRALHTLALSREDRFAPWGGTADASGKLRGYVYLGGTLGERHFATGFTMRSAEGTDSETIEAAANRSASHLLEAADEPEGLRGAIDALCRLFAPLLPERYREVLSLRHFVAAQPNLHRGQRFLRPHLDDPLHDGFGVVIVTIAMEGSGRIVMESSPLAEASELTCFRMGPGEAYALSSTARNACRHGVLADDGSRESLNLRFGLHSGGAVPGEPAGFDAHAEVECHWEREQL